MGRPLTSDSRRPRRSGGPLPSHSEGYKSISLNEEMNRRLKRKLDVKLNSSLFNQLCLISFFQAGGHR